MNQEIIVVAVDFSDACDAAFAEARRLSAAFGLPLRVLHVAEQHDVEHEQRAHAWISRQELGVAHIITLPGTPWVQIARYVEDSNPLMVVIGSHGQRGYQPLAPGSTATQLLARSTVPVLVVSSKPAAIQRRPQSPIHSEAGKFDA
jgi:nucleotide-binding universal stress UspA family protein